MNETTQIIISIAALVVTAGLSVFLWFSIVKESKRVKEEKKMKLEGVLGIPEFSTFVSTYITKVNATFSLLHIDIDSFVEVGEAFGEDESYHTLEIVAKRIRSVLPANAKIGRFEADAFVVFLNKDYERMQILNLTQRIRDVVGEPITIFEDAEISLTVSIGIAFYPIHGETVKDLMQSLKLVTYSVKKAGGNGIKIYSGELENDELTDHMEYYYQIRNAIEQKQFQLYYQPMIDVVNRKPYALESLLRWNHPEHGILSPSRFINIMEQSGDIYWVGLWGFETLVSSYFDFVKINRDIKVSINLSPKQLLNNQIAKDFQKIVRKYHIDPKNVILEVSEFNMFDKQGELLSNLVKLKDVGFLIAVDGFGVDFNSLNKVENLKIDMLKIDKSYLLEDESAAQSRFMEALVGIADENNIVVVSEEISDKELYNKALSYKIRVLQGYYLCAPQTKTEMENYLSVQEYTRTINNEGPSRFSVEPKPEVKVAETRQNNPEPKVTENDSSFDEDNDISNH